MSQNNKAPATQGNLHQLGTFTNSAGQTFPVRGLTPLAIEQISENIKAQWARDGKSLPVCPTYVIPASLANEEEIHDHDETTLVVPGDEKQTKINQQNWREFTRKSSQLESDINSALMKKVFLCVLTEPTDEWREQAQFEGVVLPAKGSAAERYLYVKDEVIQSVNDVPVLMATVMGQGGTIRQEDVETAKATFQSSMERAIAEISGETTPPGPVEK